MITRVLVASLLVLVLAVPAAAREVAGVEVAERISRPDGTELQLNGAGIRTKFVFKIYLAMLYLENPARDPAAVIGDPGSKQLIMHFLYKEVDRDDLVKAWNEGFANNGSAAQLDSLKGEIERFNAMFETVRAGDRVVLDYVPGTGTVVTIGATDKGTIAGKEFNDLLLSIWLGAKPVTAELRQALLGN